MLDETADPVGYAEDEGVELRPGVSVRHAKWGVGRVQRVDPGTSPKVVVDFVGAGRKIIIARYLRPA